MKLFKLGSSRSVHLRLLHSPPSFSTSLCQLDAFQTDGNMSSLNHILRRRVLMRENRQIIGQSSLCRLLLERIVHSQIAHHLVSNNRLPESQYAHRSGRSMESAVLKVFSDLVDALDKGQYALPSLLDLSAAFDTVDRDILLRRLFVSFCSDSSDVLSWFRKVDGAGASCMRSVPGVGSRADSLHAVYCDRRQYHSCTPLLR